MLWGVSMWELTLTYWADYESTPMSKPVRWQPNILDRLEAILKGQADGNA